MKTWQSFAVITTWNYDSYRGLSASKRDANNQGPSYNYSPGGRLTYTRWARSGQYIGINYNALGLPVTRYYPGTGPAHWTFTYDRRNRNVSAWQAGNSTTLYYNDAGQPTGAAYTGGSLSGYALTNRYDSLLRKQYGAVRAPNGTWYALRNCTTTMLHGSAAPGTGTTFLLRTRI
jgi:hypothetical protein